MDTSENSGESELVEVKKADDEEPEEEEDAEGKEKPAEKREEENTLLTNGRLLMLLDILTQLSPFKIWHKMSEDDNEGM